MGATNTNIVVGAPGEQDNAGAAYEFEGDTTQPSFGDLLLTIPSPVATPPAYFGAAVAGIGNDVIVGAPLADLAGAIGGVFLFNGTSGAPITSIAGPSGSPIGFGAAVASVGSNILIGSPDDDSGAGAAFLYAPPALPGDPATLLTTFDQPDGGGNFGASVAGTENTALIGAPGRTWVRPTPAPPIFSMPIRRIS